MDLTFGVVIRRGKDRGCGKGPRLCVRRVGSVPYVSTGIFATVVAVCELCIYHAYDTEKSPPGIDLAQVAYKN